MTPVANRQFRAFVQATGHVTIAETKPDPKDYPGALPHMLKAGDALNHGKFAESPEVVQLIGKRLAEGQTVTDSRVGLGDRIIQVTAGAATAVGTAAGLAISAPVAVIDPRTRESLGGHVEQLGRSASDVAAP